MVSTTGCHNLGYLNEMDGQLPEATKWYQLACSHGLGWSCFNLGLLEKKAGRADQALSLFRQACESSQSPEYRACTELAQRKELPDKHTLEASRLLQLACDHQQDHACVTLGALQQKSNDLVGARKNLSRACDRDNFLGCEHLAFLDEKQHRFQESARHFRHACRPELPQSCAEADVLELKPGAEDKRKALYQQQCELRNAWGCNRLGYLEEQARHLEVGSEFFEKSCALGDSFGCDQRRTLELYGQPNEDPDKSIQIRSLENGLTLVLFPYSRETEVLVELEVDAGSDDDATFGPEVAAYAEQIVLENFSSGFRKGEERPAIARHNDRTIFYVSSAAARAEHLIEQFARILESRDLRDADLEKAKEYFRTIKPAFRGLISELVAPDSLGLLSMEFGKRPYREGFWPRLLRSGRPPAKQRIQELIDRHYRRRSSTLLVIGNFDPKRVEEQTTRLFGSSPSEPGVERIFPAIVPRSLPYFRQQFSPTASVVAWGTKFTSISAEGELVLRSYVEYLSWHLPERFAATNDTPHAQAPSIYVDQRRFGYGLVNLDASQVRDRQNLDQIRKFVRDQTSGNLMPREVQEVVDTHLRELKRAAENDLWSLERRAHTLLKFKKRHHTQQTPFEVLQGLSPEQFRQHLAALFRPEQEVCIRWHSPFAFVLGLLALICCIIGLSTLLCLLIFTGALPRSGAIRYQEPLRHSWVARLGFWSVPLGLIIAGFVATGAVYLLLARNELIQDYWFLSQYLAGSAIWLVCISGVGGWVWLVPWPPVLETPPRNPT